jgi:hypothetical protein
LLLSVGGAGAPLSPPPRRTTPESTPTTDNFRTPPTDGLRVEPSTSRLQLMDRKFAQTITFYSDHPDTMVELAEEWDALQASQEIMGYAGLRIFADRDDPGRYVMIAEFGSVDPDVTAAQEAFLNNERAQTHDFADRFRAISTSEPEWHHYDEIYSTQDL